MFIDVTRYGAARTLRLAIAAVAYLDEAHDSGVVHLLGGEALRVQELPTEIEARIAAMPRVATVEMGSHRIEYVSPVCGAETNAPKKQPARKRA